MPYLVFDDPKLGRVELNLESAPVTIGRDPKASLTVRSAEVSRFHCRIALTEAGTWEVFDLNSKNGTHLNDHLIARPTPVTAGDRIQVGPATILVAEGEVSSTPLREADDSGDAAARFGTVRAKRADVVAARADTDASSPESSGPPTARSSVLPPVAPSAPSASGTARPLMDSGRARRAVATEAFSPSGDIARLNALSQSIGTEQDLEKLFPEILDAVLNFTRFERGILLLGERGKLRPVVARKLDLDHLGATEQRFSQAVVDLGVERREPTFLLDGDGDSQADLKKSWVALELMGAVCVPLLAPSEPGGAPETETLVGAIYLDTRGPIRRFSANDRQRLETIGAHLAIALANAQRHFEATREIRRLKRQEVELRNRLDEALGSEGIIGTHPSLRALLARARSLGESDVTILLVGETGTGKEVFASAIHRASGRRDRPIVKLNCAALPDTLLESELFGHERGAFTGAASQRLGRFELAHGGTLFLDEIGDVSPSMQAKLLRVLQEGEFERVGGSKTIKIDVRIIAATHRDLPALVRAGTFRQDLLFRLNVVALEIPPLRERGEDITLLAEHFFQRFRDKERRPHLTGIAPEALVWLKRQPFPGNVRELEHFVHRAVLFATGPRLAIEDFPRTTPLAEAPAGRFDSGARPPHASGPSPSAPVTSPHATTVASAPTAAGAGSPAGADAEEPGTWEACRRAQRAAAHRIEKAFFERALRRQNGNVSAIARDLGMNRSALHRRLSQVHKIDPRAFRLPEEI